MKNAFIFHGTEGYPDENWFPWLKKELERLNYKVYVPQFPSPPNVPAEINKWFDVLNDYNEYINEETILIGHSLGGIFLLRFLERIQHMVKMSVFVGTPIGIRPILNYDRDSSFSGFAFDWNNIREKSESFIVFQSDNDPYVSLGNGEELAKNLNTSLNFVPHAGHFNTKSGYTTFDLLLEKLKKVL
jgi:hypothetical protein